MSKKDILIIENLADFEKVVDFQGMLDYAKTGKQN